MFKKGDKHELIKKIQEDLIKLNIDCGIVDGDYGSKTAEGVKEFIREFLSSGNTVSAEVFAELSRTAIDKENKEDSGDIKPGGFSLAKLDAISKIDCEQNYVWNGVEGAYYKRYIKPWVEGTNSYKKQYYPACAMGVHFWLKVAGMELPFFYKGTSLALVGGFRKWGSDLGLYEVDKWEKTIPAFSLLIFNNTSHIGINYKDCNAQDRKIYTREVNRSRAVVEGVRERTSIQGFIPLKSLEAKNN